MKKLMPVVILALFVCSFCSCGRKAALNEEAPIVEVTGTVVSVEDHILTIIADGAEKKFDIQTAAVDVGESGLIADSAVKVCYYDKAGDEEEPIKAVTVSFMNDGTAE